MLQHFVVTYIWFGFAYKYSHANTNISLSIFVSGLKNEDSVKS